MLLSRANLFLFLFLFLVFACDRGRQRKEQEFFDLEQFLDGQIRTLSSIETELLKLTIVDDSTDHVILQHDSSGWAREMSVFRTADIHKPGLRNFYTKTLIDSGSWEIVKYELMDTTQSETLFLKIFSDKNSDSILKIEALQRTKNPIYNSKRKLFLTLAPLEDGRMRLDSFHVRGYQKMVMQDSIQYASSGKVLLNQEAR